MSNIVQSVWIGNKLSILEILSINSFINNNHIYHLYTYDEILNVPKNVVVKDANQILSADKIFTYHGGSYAGFSDWFRNELIYKKGNFYVDLDVICLKKFNFREDIVFGLEQTGIVNSAIMKFPAGHEFNKSLSKLCEEPNMIMPWDTKKRKRIKYIRKYLKGNKRSNIDWGETAGPIGFSSALKHYNLFYKAKPYTYFFPIPYICWSSIFDETFNDNFEYFHNSYAIHLWNNMFQEKIDKNGKFPPKSLIEQLKKEYL